MTPDSPLFSTSSAIGPGRVPSASAVVVVGNPEPASRTRAVGELVARHVASLTSAPDDVLVIELADVGARLLDWRDRSVDELKAIVAGSQALVVATPTYKASFTGLLKLFIDRFDRHELDGLPTVAVMTGATPLHALAVDTQLRPVLTEIGASQPARGLFLCGPEIDEPHAAVADWWNGARIPLERMIWR
ncbi:MAG: NAD(P)H-dependent oxidoreductase [Acidimicrobiales bacterium]